MLMYIPALLKVAVLMAAAWLIRRWGLPLVLKWTRRAECELGEVAVTALLERIIPWSVWLSVYYLLGQLVESRRIIYLGQHLLTAVFIISVSRGLVKIAAAAVQVYANRNSRLVSSTSILKNLACCIIGIMGVMLVLHSFDISVAPLLTALGVGGLAVALALQDTLSNFFAGLHLLAAQPIRPGDYIRLDSGEEGYVVDITWRNTSIEDLAQNMIIVPNSKMAEAKLVNYNMPYKHVLIQIPLSVSYDSDLDKVEKIILEVAEAVTGGIPDSGCRQCPAVRFHSFGDNSVELNILLCARQFSAQYYIRHEFIKRLQRRFIAEAIEIPEPMHHVVLYHAAGEPTDCIK